MSRGGPTRARTLRAIATYRATHPRKTPRRASLHGSTLARRRAGAIAARRKVGRRDRPTAAERAIQVRDVGLSLRETVLRTR